MKVAIIALALAVLFPHLDQPTSTRYARSIYEESQVHNVKVSTIVARTYVESGFHNIVSKQFACKTRRINRKKVRYCRQSFGLMQPEVTPVSNPEYIDREHELMTPEVNFAIGVKALGYWKRWHKYGCHQKPSHPFWLHYKYGYVIPPGKRRKPRSGWKMDNFKRKWYRIVKAVTPR